MASASPLLHSLIRTSIKEVMMMMMMMMMMQSAGGRGLDDQLFGVLTRLCFQVKSPTEPGTVFDTLNGEPW